MHTGTIADAIVNTEIVLTGNIDAEYNIIIVSAISVVVVVSNRCNVAAWVGNYLNSAIVFRNLKVVLSGNKAGVNDVIIHLALINSDMRRVGDSKFHLVHCILVSINIECGSAGNVGTIRSVNRLRWAVNFEIINFVFSGAQPNAPVKISDWSVVKGLMA